MMEFIHNDVIVIVWTGDLRQLHGVKTLNTNKQVVQRLRSVIPYMQLTKVHILQDIPERVPALLQDFFPMGDKKKLCSRMACPESLVVEGRDNRFAYACGGDDQIAVSSIQRTLSVQLLQHFFLIIVRLDVEVKVVWIDLFYDSEPPSTVPHVLHPQLHTA